MNYRNDAPIPIHDSFDAWKERQKAKETRPETAYERNVRLGREAHEKGSPDRVTAVPKEDEERRDDDTKKDDVKDAFERNAAACRDAWRKGSPDRVTAKK